MHELLKLKKVGKYLYLNEIKLRGVEEFEIKQSSDLPCGMAELRIKIIVEYTDNKQEQGPSLVEKEYMRKQDLDTGMVVETNVSVCKNQKILLQNGNTVISEDENGISIMANEITLESDKRSQISLSEDD